MLIFARVVPFVPLISPRLLTFVHIFLAPKLMLASSRPDTKQHTSTAHFLQSNVSVVKVRFISHWYSL